MSNDDQTTHDPVPVPDEIAHGMTARGDMSLIEGMAPEGKGMPPMGLAPTLPEVRISSLSPAPTPPQQPSDASTSARPAGDDPRP